MFDLSIIPFTRYGSYMAFSHLEEPDGLYLRSVRGPGLVAWQSVFRLELLEGNHPVDFVEKASPDVLRLENKHGFAEICMPTPGTIRIYCSGVNIRFTRPASGYDYLIRKATDVWQLTVCGDFEARYMLGLLAGSLNVETGWGGVRSSGMVVQLNAEVGNQIAEMVIEEYFTSWQSNTFSESFAECVSRVNAEFDAWKAGMEPVPAEYESARELACYLTWSCVVDPAGLITRPSMYMSKNNMASIWSWDNCFNALALVPGNPALAWDQLMVMVDHQAPDGSLPDLLNDMIISRSFFKPPVYGWAINKLWQDCDLSQRQLEEMYRPLCRNTEWWFAFRVFNEEGLPFYDHGNDSGWDNSTIFAQLPPVESPDLSTYLILQMETLAKMAAALGLEDEALGWSVRAKALLQKMLRRFWCKDHFVAIQAVDQTVIEAESLQLYIPLLLGKRLPDDVIQALVRGLQTENRFLTVYGLATESISSPHYQPDGYWRGPIWGAPMVFIIEGLKAVGELGFAKDLARRFCNLCVRSGMAENYNALTGVPLRDKAFTWTSSHFFLIAGELLE